MDIIETKVRPATIDELAKLVANIPKLKCLLCNGIKFTFLPTAVGLVSTTNNDVTVKVPKAGEISKISLNVDSVYRVVCRNCGFTYLFSFLDRFEENRPEKIPKEGMFDSSILDPKIFDTKNKDK